MREFSYSVAIRTLGTAGEKYEKLLKSIQKQTIQPEKIVVVLPEGYKKPEFQIGTEQFVYSKKGMMPQRVKALDYIDSEYVWFCDDDIEAEPQYIQKLAKALAKGYDCAAGPLLDIFPPKSIKYFFASFLGGACVMLRGRKTQYVRLLKTGGWSYNRNIDLTKNQIYDTDSMAGANFVANTKVMKAIHLEDEYWAEKSGFSAFEDRIMVGKLVVNGYKCCVVANASYLHNDGGTSMHNLRTEPMYAASFNHYVFWHRFLYCQPKTELERRLYKLAIEYYILMTNIYNLALVLSKRQTKAGYEAIGQGFKDAKMFVKGKEYKCLRNVIVE